MSWARQRGVAVRIKVWLQPRAAKTQIVGVQSDCLRVRVTAAPAKSEANEQLRAMLARCLGIPPTSIRLVSGQTSRLKVLEIAEASVDDITKKLLGH